VALMQCKRSIIRQARYCSLEKMCFPPSATASATDRVHIGKAGNVLRTSVLQILLRLSRFLTATSNGLKQRAKVP
jgi:hypothetical protein